MKTLNIDTLQPIQLQRTSAHGITINASGLYISNQRAQQYNMENWQYVVTFEHGDAFVMCGFEHVQHVPHAWRAYISDVTKVLHNESVQALRISSSELVRRYGKQRVLEIEPVRIGEYNGYLLRPTVIANVEQTTTQAL